MIFSYEKQQKIFLARHMQPLLFLFISSVLYAGDYIKVSKHVSYFNRGMNIVKVEKNGKMLFINAPYFLAKDAVEQNKAKLTLIICLNYRSSMNGGVALDNQAVSTLKHRFDALFDNYIYTSAVMWYFGDKNLSDGKPIMPFTERIDMPGNFVLTLPAILIVSKNGRGFLIDCGNKRVLEKLDELTVSGQLKGIDGCFVTHYHDDDGQSSLFFIGDSFSPSGMDDYCPQNRHFWEGNRGYDYYNNGRDKTSG